MTSLLHPMAPLSPPLQTVAASASRAPPPMPRLRALPPSSALVHSLLRPSILCLFLCLRMPLESLVIFSSSAQVTPVSLDSGWTLLGASPGRGCTLSLRTSWRLDRWAPMGSRGWPLVACILLFWIQTARCVYFSCMGLSPSVVSAPLHRRMCLVLPRTFLDCPRLGRCCCCRSCSMEETRVHHVGLLLLFTFGGCHFPDQLGSSPLAGPSPYESALPLRASRPASNEDVMCIDSSARRTLRSTESFLGLLLHAQHQHYTLIGS